MSLNNFHYYEEGRILAGFVLHFTFDNTISYDIQKEREWVSVSIVMIFSVEIIRIHITTEYKTNLHLDHRPYYPGVSANRVRITAHREEVPLAEVDVEVVYILKLIKSLPKIF